MNRIVIPALLLGAAVFASAADTKPVKNPDGNCAVSVPANWSAGSYGDAQSPDKKVSLVVSSPKHGLTTLTQVRQLAPTIYKDDKVVKDSGSQFEMEGMGLTGKPNVYFAIPAEAKVCIAEITYESGTAADAKGIIETLKASK